MAVGYSKRSLADKLRVKSDMRLIVLGAPFIQQFARQRAQLESAFPRLVDVKVCAVDATWSGLQFVRRLADCSSAPRSAAPRQ